MLRLYSIQTGPVARACDGCQTTIPPASEAVLRGDYAVFHDYSCAVEHDDGFMERPARLPLAAVPEPTP